VSATVAAAAKPAKAENDYRDLKARVAAAGLLERQPVYYAAKFVVTLALYAGGVVAVLAAGTLWLQLAAAVFMAFVFGQVGLLMHDSAHRQTNGTGRLNDVLCLLTGPVLLGVSTSWWADKHNRHHSFPNHLEKDPDVNIAGISFTQDQARTKRGLVRALNAYQAWIFFPVLLLEGFHLRFESIRYLLFHRPRLRVQEGALIAVHMAGYGLVVSTLGLWPAIAVTLVHHGLTGLYVGSIFAPNHKGMAMVDDEDDLDFVRRQVLTARNVKASPLTDFWYGGLNYQIEHHLFPNLPRNKLRHAQAIVREFCAERGISYYETGMFRSYREVLAYLHTASEPLRDIFEY
jgi:fatty acid desaturase